VLNDNVVTLFRGNFDSRYDRGKDDLYAVTITNISFISVEEIRRETNGDSHYGLKNGLICVEYLIDNTTGYDVYLNLPFELYQITNTNYEKPYEQYEFRLYAFEGLITNSEGLITDADGRGHYGYYLPYIEYADGSRGYPSWSSEARRIRPKEKATATEYFSLNEKDSNADIELVLSSTVLGDAIGNQEWSKLYEQGKYPKDFILSYHMDDLR
jgi:hypothetical protein